MSTGAKIGLGLVVFVVLFLGSCGMMVLGVKNTCISNESDIDAQYKNNKIALAGYTNKIMDMVQVPKMAVGHIKEVATAAIQGRYGEKGSQALFQAIQEQNPSVDPGLYRQLMQAMEAGRNSFDADQASLMDKCRVYEKYRQQEPQEIFVSFFGFPKFDKTECTPVTTAQTEQDFKTKTTGPLQINP
jgi:hypothetical protein